MTNPVSAKSKQPSVAKPSTTYQLPPTNRGFTIVELLVVIVVIGILAAITVVAYTGISQKAIASTLQSDLANAVKKLKLYQVDYGAYPANIVSNCPTGPTDAIYCLKPSPGDNYTSYRVGVSGSQTFCLTVQNDNGVNYHITDSSGPKVGIPSTGTCQGVKPDGTTCPSGFIAVPGNQALYGTNDFCVMKYEAKDVGDIATSQAVGTPWVIIPQTGVGSATEKSIAACTGCHLITEAEWMTIAQNVLSVNANWSGGTVGTGCIFRGNTGYDGDCEYVGANPEYGIGGRNAKASLTLTNGEVIWDLAGNVWEWTSGQMTGGQPTGMASWSWYQWKNVSGGTFAVNPYPSGTGISGSGSWDHNQGIGGLDGFSYDTSLRGFVRGGSYGSGDEDSGGYKSGVLALILYNAPSGTGTAVGFRVSR